MTVYRVLAFDHSNFSQAAGLINRLPELEFSVLVREQPAPVMMGLQRKL